MSRRSPRSIADRLWEVRELSTVVILLVEIVFFGWYLWPEGNRPHPFLNLPNAVLILKYSSIYGIAAVGAGTAVADANSNGRAKPVAAVSATPATVVMGAAPAPGHYETINGVSTWVPASVTVTPGVNYDHDADGVLNHTDRYPNDPSRS